MASRVYIYIFICTKTWIDCSQHIDMVRRISSLNLILNLAVEEQKTEGGGGGGGPDNKVQF